MARGYRHIQEYEEKLLELKAQGLTVREIGERFGFTYEQTHDLFKRYNRKQRKIAAGIAVKKKGRPPKNYQVSEEDITFCQPRQKACFSAFWAKIGQNQAK